MTDDLISLAEAAALVGLEPATLRNYVVRSQPRLPTVPIGNKRYTTRAALFEWDAARKVGAKAAVLAPITDSRLTLAQAAQIVGLKPGTLRAYAEGRLEPILPTELMGRARVVDPAVLQSWLRERKTGQR